MCFKWKQVNPEIISADERRKLDEKIKKQNDEILKKQYENDANNELKKISNYINIINNNNGNFIYLSSIFEKNIYFLTTVKGYKVEFIKGKGTYMTDINGAFITAEDPYDRKCFVENTFKNIYCYDGKIINDGDNHYKISW